MKAIRLQCEYLNNPIGIDIPRPRLMWNAEGGVRQTAYQIVSDNWDSGKVESASMHADYPKELHDRERVNWRIRLWDENGQSGQWSEAFFERGISAWDAKWITGNYGVKRKKRYPVDCFRRAFEVRESVKSARLYITACGLYEAKISGALVGDFAMAPGYTGYTDYRKRVQYQTYDVTSMLHTGENEITVQLADGWYRGSCGAWGLRNQYGAQTKLLAQLEITYEDGSRDTIVTDKRWQWSNDGAIRFADNKDGEVMRSMNGSVGWSDVGILMPWRYSKKYGDDRILAEFYDGMSRYARFMEKRCGKNMPIFAEHIRLKGEAKKYLDNTGQSYGK